jgi:release factor glutamine methyltransferase
VTVLEAIQKSADFLAKKGVDSPRLQSELLLAHVLKTQRLKLYLDFARALSEQETTTLRDLVQRRGNREPLQHILGTAFFCGLEMKVNSNVLVPRPETELLAEHAWKFLNSLGRDSTFLDFGTGSGCIAIAVCHHAKQSRSRAIDRSTEALAVATENASLSKVSDRLTFLESDGFKSLNPADRFDLIVSNPPYIPSQEIESLQEEVRDYDPRAALDGGADGLDFYRMLGSESAHFLADRGKMMLEFGDGQESVLPSLFSATGWQVESVECDYTQRPRFLILRRS